MTTELPKETRIMVRILQFIQDEHKCFHEIDKQFLAPAREVKNACDHLVSLGLISYYDPYYQIPYEKYRILQECITEAIATMILRKKIKDETGE